MTPQAEADYGTGWVPASLPRGWKESMKLQAIFTDDFPSATLSGGSGYEFVNSTDDSMATKLISCITSGEGIFRGVPYRIWVGNPRTYLFDGAIDLRQCTQECDKITAPLKYVNAIDWFNTAASGITFLSLTQQGLSDAGINITSWPGYSSYNALIGPPSSGAKYSYKVVPYVQTQETDIAQVITLVLEEISMFAHDQTAVVNTVAIVKKIIADITEAVSVAATVPGLIQLGFDILALLAQFAWDALLVAAQIGNFEMLLNQFGLLIKYKYAMTASDIIHSAIDYLNNYMGTPSGNPITFKSSILDSGVYANTTIMPRKTLKENTSDNILTNLWNSLTFKGGEITRGTEVGVNYTYGYPDTTFKDFLTQLGKVFNAKCFLSNGVLRFEEVHYNVPGTFTLPNTDKPGYNFNWPQPDGYNAMELPFNYRIAFQTDISDERTMIVYTGTTCNVCTQPKTCANVAYFFPADGEDITFSFALAKRKEYLNLIQQIVNDIFQFVAQIYIDIIISIDAVITSINDIFHFLGIHVTIPLIPIPSYTIPLYVGMLELSNDTFNIPKIFIGTPVGNYWYLDANNGQNYNNVWNNPNVPASTPGRGEGNMSAWALMNTFHCKNLALYNPVNALGNALPQVNNQWLLYKNKHFPMCASDYGSLLGNNIFVTADGKLAKFEKIPYDVYDNMADGADYRVSYIYDTNFITTTTIDGN